MGSKRENEKAKRAILGLCDYEMDNNGVLTEIKANRNGDIIIPKGCVEIADEAIPINHTGFTVKFCGDIEKISLNAFSDINGFTTSDLPLIINFWECRARSVCAIVTGLCSLRHSTEIKAEYIFSESKFAEQLAGLFVGAWGYKGSWGLRTYTDKILAGETDISDKIFNPTILAEILNALEKEFKFMENYTKSYFGNIAERIGVSLQI